jgi:hypothetical protein
LSRCDRREIVHFGDPVASDFEAPAGVILDGGEQCAGLRRGTIALQIDTIFVLVANQQLIGDAGAGARLDLKAARTVPTRGGDTL